MLAGQGPTVPQGDNSPRTPATPSILIERFEPSFLSGNQTLRVTGNGTSGSYGGDSGEP